MIKIILIYVFLVILDIFLTYLGVWGEQSGVIAFFIISISALVAMMLEHYNV